MSLKQTVNEIKRAVSCVDVARLCGLNISRPGDRCRSPFHNGTSESFVCYATHWVAWSDDKSGDCIDLYAELKCGANKGRAIRELAERYNISLDAPTAQWEAETQRLNDQAQYYHSKLRAEDREYLHGRGITDATISDLRLGYREGEGITVPYYKNGYVYDITTRRYEGEPRYLRLSGTSDSDPWGIFTLGRFTKPVWLCEGTFDAITVFQYGDAVLVSTKPPIDTISARNIILCYDNDDTGQRYTASVAQSLMRQGIPFQIAQLSDCKDLNEYWVRYGRMPAYLPGMQYLASQVVAAVDIWKYVSRHTPHEAFEEFINLTSLDKDTKNRFIANHNKPPSDRIICSEIEDDIHPIYLNGDAFYRFTGRIWERMDEAQMKQRISRQWDEHTSQARINSALGVLKAECLRTDVTFNRKPLWVFNNGTLELDTGTFRESRSEDYASIIMDYNYQPDAPCPMWEQFIRQVTDGDGHRELLLQYIAGYVLFPDCRHQKIFVLLGSGGNGKSVYLDVLAQVYGPKNVSHLEPHDLTEQFKQIMLKDSLLNLATEINDRFTESAQRLKAISAGESVTDSYKGKDNINFYPRAKLVFAANEMPSSDYVRGLDRRLMFCDFPMKFVDYPSKPNELKKDINLISKLLTELPGIFNWAYRGYRMLLEEGEFNETFEQDELMQQFREVSDPVVSFVGEFLPSDEFMTTEDVYDGYCAWCRRTNNKLLTRQKFTERFTDAIRPYGGEKVRKRTEDGQQRGFQFPREYLMREVASAAESPIYWTP